MGQETGTTELKFYDVEVAPNQLDCVTFEEFKSYGSSVQQFCLDSDRQFCKKKSAEGLCARAILYKTALKKNNTPQAKTEGTSEILPDGYTAIDPKTIIPNFLNFLEKFGKIELNPPGLVIRAKTADLISQGWGREVQQI